MHGECILTIQDLQEGVRHSGRATGDSPGLLLNQIFLPIFAYHFAYFYDNIAQIYQVIISHMQLEHSTLLSKILSEEPCS